MKRLFSYTREPIDNVYYDPRLAYSMHLAIEDESGEISILNHNSGILFAKATENADGSLNPKSIKYPCIYPSDNGGYKIYAIRTLADGEQDDEDIDKVCVFSTIDFVTYEEEKMVFAPEKYKVDVRSLKAGEELTEINNRFPAGTHICNSVEISDEIAQRLKNKFITPYHIKTIFPDKIMVNNAEELRAIKAVKVFSDGTENNAVVDWMTDDIDLTQNGEYEIYGRIHQDHYGFPMAENHADPCIGRWQNKYYFIATYDADHEHTMYIREADSIPELVDAEEHLILDSVSYEGIGGLLWAPELHVIGGKLCIMHAATPGPFFEEESRVMILKEGGDPIVKEDWEAPRRIVRADGSDICEAGKEITLDMTHFVWEGEDYVIWSQRQFVPKDLGAWLYIAKLDPQEPWKLASEPFVLTKPEYGWENNHTFVVEGPFALVRNGVLHITYSAAAVDTSYVVGLLSIKAGKDILDRSNWKKTNYPILTSRSVEGEFGTGHNAYVQDDNGDIWNTYHARPGVDAPRCSGIRQVHFDVDDEPMLDVTEELSLNRELANIKTILQIKK